jgi:hypothetical protein
MVLDRALAVLAATARSFFASSIGSFASALASAEGGTFFRPMANAAGARSGARAGDL